MINNDNFYYSEKQQNIKLLKFLCATSFTLASIITYLICRESKSEVEQEKIQEQEKISLELEKEGTRPFLENGDTIDLSTLIKKELADIIYNENAKVIYNDKIYSLNSLYRLYNNDNEHICYLDKDTYYYYDIDTDCAIAIKDYENLSLYNVESLSATISYQNKYGNLKESIILEDDFVNNINKSNNQSKTKIITYK